MAQEQVEIEFRNEMQQLMAMRQNPQAAMNPQMAMQAKMTAEKIEARKAQLIADMMEEFMKEEKKITSQFDNDPVAKLRARELDLQAQENARKKREGEERITLDRMRTMMNQSNQEEKLDQNEELANLRANTSIEKTILSKTLPSAKDMGSGSVIIKKED
jgi:serine phosphatase RsbU (regulator of sigma subunit)